MYFEEKDYRSWQVVWLSIGVSEEEGVVYIHTRTGIGCSHYDFPMQNRTVREFRRRFGGTVQKDDGDGEGYDPGAPLPPAASGCHLVMQGLDWNLTRVNKYLTVDFVLPNANPSASLESIWPQMRQLNPGVFIRNILTTYLVSTMEEYFKGTYIALLTYADRKPIILKGARLSGEQLAEVSAGRLSVEQAVAELLPFQRLSAVGRHFAEIDQSLDVLGPLKRPYGRRKVNLLDRLESLVSHRHALIHEMQIDIALDSDILKEYIHDLTMGISRVYKGITHHFGWPFELPMSSNFILSRHRRTRSKEAKSIISAEGEEMVVIPAPDDQNPCAQLRGPMDMMRHGWSVSLFQASQQWSTMAS